MKNNSTLFNRGDKNFRPVATQHQEKLDQHSSENGNNTATFYIFILN